MPLNIPSIRAICFDVDGTLSDTDDLMVLKLVRLLKPFHFLYPKQKIVHLARRIIMGIEAPGNIAISIPDMLGLDNLLFPLFDWLSRHIKKESRNFLLIPGVKEMLEEISQWYPLAVVSARDKRTTELFLDQFNLRQYFKCIATAQTCNHTKPFPDPILWAAQELKVPVETCLMVGDTTVDMRAAAAAGAHKVGVLCGFGEQKELERYEADLILATTSELASILQMAIKMP
jgi:phosphoglycolate phosphatase-like HAD superfamily hydrolase